MNSRMSCCAANCLPVLIQQNFGGSNTFNRSWAEFKVGFNDSNGNYWIGNDRLSQVTQSGIYKLRVELLQTNTYRWYWVEYGVITVLGESHNYRLGVSGYSSDLNSYFGELSYQNGMMFNDRDNDPWKNGTYNDNRAVYNGGGFWYKDCGPASVNTVRGRGDDFKWGRTQLLTFRMWLTC